MTSCGGWRGQRCTELRQARDGVTHDRAAYLRVANLLQQVQEEVESVFKDEFLVASRDELLFPARHRCAQLLRGFGVSACEERLQHTEQEGAVEAVAVLAGAPELCILLCEAVYFCNKRRATRLVLCAQATEVLLIAQQRTGALLVPAQNADAIKCGSGPPHTCTRFIAEPSMQQT